MTRMFDIREPSVEALRAAPVYFRYGSNRNRVLIDALTARALLACHDALSEDNRTKFEPLLRKPHTLNKLVSLAWKHVKISA